MIRHETDPAFWEGVAAHPAVRATLGGASPEAVGALSQQAGVLALAAEHGGFLFIRRDALGFVAELHTLFTPEGWGREALVAALEAVNAVWLCGFQAIVTLEARDNARSRPPRTFGFVQAGEWRSTPIGETRLWILTRGAWNASPAQRRKLCQ